MSSKFVIGRRKVIKSTGALAALAAVGPFFHVRPALADKGELVVVSWGGSWAKSMREVIFTDFEKASGLTVKDDTPPENAKLKAMADAGNVTWDVLETDLPAIQTMIGNDLLDPLDYSKIDKAKLDKIPKELHSSHAVGNKLYSFNVVYNSKTFPTGKHPKGWADVWDGKGFPGARAFPFRGGISPQLEIALLGDGVAIDKLYPLDVARAWRSMDKLRPLVKKWFAGHAEAIQLVSSGEIDIACTVGSRGITAKRAGAPVDVEYNQGKLGADYWCVTKGSKNKKAALEFINFALDAKRQAGMVQRDPYGPANADAFNHLTAAEAKDLTTSPDNIKRQFWISEDWWGKPGADGKNENQKQKELFAEWMLKKG